MKVLLLLSLVALASAYAPSHTGPNWQTQSAAVKGTTLLNQCAANRTPYGWYSTVRIAELFVEDMNTSFDFAGDDMPAQLAGLEQRPKVIHSVGLMADAQYVSVGNHNYTGIFKGCDKVLLRLSVAKKPETKPPGVAPGIALKFIRDGVPSANVFAMYSLEGQTSFNLFEHDLTNHVPMLNPKTAPLALRLLQKAFEKASKWPTFLGSKPMAQYDQAGTYFNDDKVNYPFRLVFHPVTAVHQTGMSSAPSNDDQYFVKALQDKFFGPLYTVYAQDSPDSDQLVLIGQLNQRTAFTGSQYGDKDLFFQHSRFEDDLALRPQWAAGAQKIIDKQSSSDHFVFPDLPF
jgi:hypothetical protein